MFGPGQVAQTKPVDRRQKTGAARKVQTNSQVLLRKYLGVE